MRSSFYILILLTAFNIRSIAQSVSVAPSRIYYKVMPGFSKTQNIRVSNNSSKKQAFQVTFGDFEAPGSNGKTNLLKAGESEHSISKYISANPAFFELEPGQGKDVQILLDLPNTPDAAKVKWGTALVKLVREKTEANNAAAGNMGMGILETFQFALHIFQTPPSITNKSAEIVSMKPVAGKTSEEKSISILTKNTGEAILDCASYIELVNLKNGKKERLKPIAFTVLPGGSREVRFAIPAATEKGKYTITGVVDYGSKEDVQAAEMDLEI